MNIYADLFLTFAKVGVMTFGGGVAMLPILEREVVQNKGWTTTDELTDYYAIGQCTPGIIAVNTATFIGNKTAGVLGGIIATLGIVFPSLVIITCIASFLATFADINIVQNAFAGIRACVCALILNASIKLTKKAVVEKFKKHETDTGSPEVQVALLTEKITELTEHLKSNPKDFQGRRGLLQMVGKRKRFLSYIKDRNLEEYRALIKKLKIRG